MDAAAEPGLCYVLGALTRPRLSRLGTAVGGVKVSDVGPLGGLDYVRALTTIVGMLNKPDRTDAIARSKSCIRNLRP